MTDTCSYVAAAVFSTDDKVSVARLREQRKERANAKRVLDALKKAKRPMSAKDIARELNKASKDETITKKMVNQLLHMRQKINWGHECAKQSNNKWSLIPGGGAKAVVQTVIEPTSTITQEELNIYCKRHLSGYKVPKTMRFVDELPLSPAGKVLKRLIRERYLGKAKEKAG